MIFSDYLKKSNIIIDPVSKNRWELIDEFTDIIEKNKEIPSSAKDEIKNALVEREKSMTTGIGKSVAIPHCTSDKIENIVLSVAISQKGINFDSIDNVPVKCSILLLVPKNKLNQHIKTIAKIAKLMNDEELKDSLINSDSSDRVLKILRDYERNLNNGKK